MPQQKVKITNGDMEAWVSPRSVKAYERAGWTAADDGSSSEAPVAPAPVAPPKPKKEG